MGRPLLSASFTAVGTGASSRSFVGDTVTTHAILTGTGAVTAQVILQGSMNGEDWEDIVTIDLSGVTRASEPDTSQMGWAFVRAKCTSITGTNAVLKLMSGEA